ncbi:MAG: hypothetical protein DLM59_16330 [Pseudonocardiales bacterium]|nr:MAG: hypothetical protein DLM59_16330 [Pseudonocardiales bacterium]
MRVTHAVRAAGIWLLIALFFGVALLVADHRGSPLDDRDLAMQRPGLLDSVGARSEAPPVTTSIPATRRVTIVFFVRSAQQQPLLARLSQPGALPPTVDAAIVGGPVNLSEAPIAVLTDSDGSLARGYGMRVPRDGGYPVGYAIVGTDGVIRYRTLDPDVTRRLADVRTMLKALR